MKDSVKVSWVILGWAILAAVLISPSLGDQASLLEAVIYQLTDGNPKAVGSLFD